MTRNMYTTVDDLRIWDSDRHLCYTALQRTNSVITDADIQQRLQETCEDMSRDFDGYVRGHLDVPLVDVETALTGTITLTNGAQTLTGVGTAFDVELSPGDRIIVDSQPDIEVVIDSVTNATTAVLRYEFYGVTSAVPEAGSIITNEVPSQLELLVRGHALYVLWGRRGRQDENNPWTDKEKLFVKRCTEIQTGRYRFETAGGDEVAEKPVKYDDADAVFTRATASDPDPFEGYTDLS